MTVHLRRLSSVGVALALAAAFAAGILGAASADTILPSLYVNYTLNCTFTITNDAGASVTSMPPGNYNVEITTPEQFVNGKDRSGLADTDFSDCKGAAAFQLTGPGVNIATTLDDGSNDHALFTATFQPGSTYTAVDNNQPSVARVVFTTTTTGTPTPPATSYSNTTTTSKPTSSTDVVGSAKTKTAATPFRGTLVGAVSKAGKLSLKLKGKNVSTLKSGRYTFKVTDASRKSGFIVQEIRNAGTTVTGISFVGKKTVTLTLKAGQWFFYPTFVGKKTYFIVVG